MDKDSRELELLAMASDIVAAWVTNHTVTAKELPGLVQLVYSGLAGMPRKGVREPGREPVVPVAESVTPDYIICLNDGKRMRMLKRHLKTAYGMTPEEYREYWGLPLDYPMVAPSYAQKRSDLAHKNGLGRKRGPRRPRLEVLPEAS